MFDVESVPMETFLSDVAVLVRLAGPDYVHAREALGGFTIPIPNLDKAMSLRMRCQYEPHVISVAMPYLRKVVMEGTVYPIASTSDPYPNAYIVCTRA